MDVGAEDDVPEMVDIRAAEAVVVAVVVDLLLGDAVILPVVDRRVIAVQPDLR